MLISNHQIFTTHREISKRMVLNKTFDTFCELIFACREEIETSVATDPKTIHEKLLLYLKTNMLLNNTSGVNSFITEELNEALYAMCSLADETFLILNWKGRSFWERNLLESAFFNTHISGQEIFRRIDNLLEEGNAIYASLGEIYLKMLALGYSGKYIGADGVYEIDEYRQNLYEYIVHSDHSAAVVNDRLFDTEYANIVAPTNRQLLPNPHIWNRMLLLYIVCFTTIGIIIWHFNTEGLFNKVVEIEEIVVHSLES